MEIKNLNTGTIHANSANIGDTYNVTNVIEGLAFLLSDYQAQIKNINRLIFEFKPITALDLLIDLEKRITETNIPNDNKISSKILFLKALCKRELENFSKEEFKNIIFSCHDIIRNNDKFSPEMAFDEIAKILFIKFRI